jgi:hypothetical protein
MEALRKRQDKIRYTHTRHEETAALAACARAHPSPPPPSGISQNTLAQRLHDLEALGVLTRSVLSVTPPATLYTLELPGRRLSDAVTALAQWGDRWLTGNDEMRRYRPSTFVGTPADRQASALGRRNHGLSR